MTAKRNDAKHMTAKRNDAKQVTAKKNDAKQMTAKRKDPPSQATDGQAAKLITRPNKPHRRCLKIHINVLSLFQCEFCY